MSVLTYFRARAHSGCWANHRLLIARAQLTPVELEAPRTPVDRCD